MRPSQLFSLSLLLFGTLIAALPVPQDSNADAFSDMLDQYDQLQEETMEENMEMEKAQAFWKPLESMSKADATS